MPKYVAKIKDCELIVSAKFLSSEKVNETELEFFSRKSIRGFLKPKRINKMFFKGIEYSGPVGVSLDERLKKPTSKHDFLFIMEQIVNIVERTQKNGLLVNKIVWDIENIYINETTKEMQFIYLPMENRSEMVDILSFMESIIYLTNFSDRNIDYVSEFTYFIKGLKKFDVEKIEKFIASQDPGIAKLIKRPTTSSSGFMTDKPQDYYAHYNKEDEDSTRILNDEDATRMLSNDDEDATRILNDEGATRLLNDNDEDATRLLSDDGDYEATRLLTEEEDEAIQEVRYPTLYRIATQETVEINKSVLRLGKERNSVDYLVSDNKAVSRIHADIVTRGNRYFVIDLNSKNKTYINDVLIPAQKETELHDGDHLKLANEEFIFSE